MPTSGEQTGQEEKKWNPFETLLNMRREVPGFTRCCFCLPLRRGLISWGYTKLALDIAAICMMIYIQIIIRILIIFIHIELVFMFIDAAFCIVLIVGGHLKNVKLLKAAYIYSLVWLGLLVISCCWNTYLELRMALGLLSITGVHTVLWLSVPGLCVHFSLTFLQIYLVLMIRSEIQKLMEQSLEMQFTNPSAAEAQCKMHVSGRTPDVSISGTEAVECTSYTGLKESG